MHNANLHKILRVERAINYNISISKENLDITQLAPIFPALHDRMIESVSFKDESLINLFDQTSPDKIKKIDILKFGKKQLHTSNIELGLALADDEIDFLFDNYVELDRNPTDVELMMFAQANSEHCRHKIFNADWVIDGIKQNYSLFSMIKNTHEVTNGRGVLSAYSDNAAVMQGSIAERFYPISIEDNKYQYINEPINYLLKVETHNHPTAIAPYPGAATGSGGEIRDEGATGLGAKPKAGLTGFTVSNLKIPSFHQPWEIEYGKPERIVSALDIMIEGPIGGAAFNNEFGRPNVNGYFRTFEIELTIESEKQVYGYHKPIMIAGGIGNIKKEHVNKDSIPIGTPLVVLGGPAMKIGIGGGAASSMSSGSSNEELDFASVQRDNAEIEHRCQEVIDRCWQLSDKNPIVFIHDVGAGGLSNALPELVKDGGVGGKFSLRDIPTDEAGMSPLEIWCNESQERYVLAIKKEYFDVFDSICKRERAPYSIVGLAEDNNDIIVHDDFYNTNVVDLPKSILFGKPPKMVRDVKTISNAFPCIDIKKIELSDAIDRLLKLPTIASKNFLITIGDRSVGGMIHRDQMVGPWQIPVADAAVTLNSFNGYSGEAIAIGEKPSLSIINASSSARMAVAEAITNISCAQINKISDITLSANWMAASGKPGQDSNLFEAVKSVGLEFCPALGITIPVGKDSMSMSTHWRDLNEDKSVISPVSLVITASAVVNDVRLSVTPQLKNIHQSTLLHIDLGEGNQRLGGSCLAQVYSQIGDIAPDINDPNLLKNFFNITQQLIREKKIISYHDKSDGGLFITLFEMAIAGQVGLDILSNDDIIEFLFNEESGAVIQVKDEDLDYVSSLYKSNNVHFINNVAKLNTSSKSIDIKRIINNKTVSIYNKDLSALHSSWHETSYRIQSLRDNPLCAKSEFDEINNENNPGLNAKVTFDINEKFENVNILKGLKPTIAILREQGINGQYEMAAAFDRAGFDTFDIHMSDIISKKINLQKFNGLAVCGGFSYGDVLGAGEGWAKTILYNNLLKDQFSTFFDNSNTFSLGVCNGCQMLSNLKSIIPGADNWPKFVKNSSEQFEARLVMVKIPASPSIFLQGMEHSNLPIVVSHGEGRAHINQEQLSILKSTNTICLQYTDNTGEVTEKYPYNPNGSPFGIAGITSADGRVTAMMPHPERVFRTVQNSWAPADWGEDGAWMRLFRNALKNLT